MEDNRTNSEDNPSGNSVENPIGNSVDNPNGNSVNNPNGNSEVNPSRNSEEIEDKTMVAVEEYAPEIRDIYKGIKDIKGENVPPEEKDNKEGVIKKISKKKRAKKRKLSKISKGSSKTVPVIPCKMAPLKKKNWNGDYEAEASLDEPSCKAVETTLNEENLTEDNSLLNNGPRKKRKISKKVKMSEEYILQNFPGAIRRSPRIMEKQFKDNILRDFIALQQENPSCPLSSEMEENSTLIENSTSVKTSTSIESSTIQNSTPILSTIGSETQKKKSALHKVMKNSQVIRKRKHKSRKSISLQTCLNEAPTSFERFAVKNGRKFFGFRWTGHKRILDVPVEELTEPMKILLKTVLQSTLTDVNNPLYFASVDNTSKNSLEVTNPGSMENNASVSNTDCFGFDKTMRTILQYRKVQNQMQSKYVISNGETTASDVDVKFHIE